MLRNYVVVAWRALLRHKLYSTINIVGLAAGLAGCLVISIYVRDQLSYDAWVHAGDRIYRIESAFTLPGRDTMHAATTPAPVARTMQQHFAQIVGATRLFQNEPTVKRGTLVSNEPVIYADPNVLELFDLALVRGDRKTALADASSVVLSEAMARKWLEPGDPLGQVLSVTRRGKTRDLRVAGVLRDLPHATHLRLDFIVQAEREVDEGTEVDQWGDAAAYTYVKLRAPSDLPSIVAGLSAYAHRFIPTFNMGDTTFNLTEILKLSFVNIRDIQLHSTATGQMKATGDFRMVSTIAIVALLILLIASINYMNLTTARAGQREREIAMRKVLGATRGQVVLQFLGESTLLATLALVLALAAVEVTLPVFNRMLGTALAVQYGGGESLLVQALALIFIVGIGGGLYPAFYLSRFEPAAALKSNRSHGSDASARVRAVLVPIQFAIMITIVVCTAVVYVQTSYSRARDLGFNREHLLTVFDLNRGTVAPSALALLDEVRRLPGVVGAARATHVPGDDSDFNIVVERPGHAAGKAGLFDRNVVDGNFFELMGIPLIAGRPLSPDVARDEASIGDDPTTLAALKARGFNIMVDDRARERLGFPSAAAAIGQVVHVMLPDPVAATIVGVTAPYLFRSTRSSAIPAVFLKNDPEFSRLVVRYTGSGPAAMAAVEAAWRRLLPDAPFHAEFIETTLAAQYADEEARGRIFGLFSALAVVIACLGLFGMASFVTERRVREIGLRKVMGATVGQVVTLLLGQFSIPVLLANVLAWPLAYWFMRDWLNGFVERIALSPVYFLSGSLIALVVAWATVAGHAWSVARSSPARALRYE